MKIYRILDEVFRTWSNIAVLRALIDTNTGYTGNEVARLSGMQPRSAIKALTLLESLGLVKRQIGGRDHIFSLNRKHYLYNGVIVKLFEIENNFLNEIINEIKSLLGKQVYSSVIFGSTARKEDTVLSDFDICIIVNSSTEQKILRDVLNQHSGYFYEKFGIKIAPIFFTKSKFQKLKKSKLFKSIVNDGILISGKHPKGLISGSTQRI